MNNGNTKAIGCLYGVGVGPGDPELLTLKAVRILQHAPVIFTPQAEGSKDSLALTVARQHIDTSRQQLIFASFVMGGTTDHVWVEAAERISGILKEGTDVAFLTQGDPLLYGSFMYVMEKIQAAHPEIPIEVIPGVTSITASAASARLPIVSHSERLAILPAMYGVDDLKDILAQFETVILMKVNSKAMKAVTQLKDEGSLRRCVFVRRATTSIEKVAFNLEGLTPEDTDYFSLLILSGQKEVPSPSLEEG